MPEPPPLPRFGLQKMGPSAIPPFWVPKNGPLRHPPILGSKKWTPPPSPPFWVAKMGGTEGGAIGGGDKGGAFQPWAIEQEPPLSSPHFKRRKWGEYRGPHFRPTCPAVFHGKWAALPSIPFRFGKGPFTSPPFWVAKMGGTEGGQLAVGTEGGYTENTPPFRYFPIRNSKNPGCASRVHTAQSLAMASAWSSTVRVAFSCRSGG